MRGGLTKRRGELIGKPVTRVDEYFTWPKSDNRVRRDDKNQFPNHSGRRLNLCVVGAILFVEKSFVYAGSLCSGVDNLVPEP